VGKTTCAAAAAVRRAEAGERVLVVSLDPAHSLGDALDTALGPEPRRVRVPRGTLFAVELGADRALARWLDERRQLFATILERGTYLDHEDVARFLDLSLPGVDELVGLLELGRLASARPYDTVVVDAAPTGHTLRLLQMPATLRQVAGVLDTMHGKHRFVAESLGGRYHADEADALIAQVEEEGSGLARGLRDAQRTRFSWVMLAESLALEETADGIGALRRDGLPVGELIVNRLTPPPPGPCPLCPRRRAGEAAVVAEARRRLPALDLRVVMAVETEPRGVAALRRLGPRPAKPPRPVRPPRPAPAGPSASRRTTPLDPALPERVRLVLFGGKGGVGKTTAAAAAALSLARAGRRVLLLSADPAHSLGDALGLGLDDRERPVAGTSLVARELDAGAAWQAKRASYHEGVDALFDRMRGVSRFDASFDRAVVRDLLDLAPPGIDELFAVLAVTDALRASRGKRRAHDVVVLDTAPTGHALRLLAMPELALEWARSFMAVLLKYRQVAGLGRLAEELLAAARDLRALAALLHAEAGTAFVAVTRPGALPRLETVRLVGRLREMRIPLAAVLVNALTPPGGCARCRRAARDEGREVARLDGSLRALTGPRPPMILAPLVAPPPVGARALSAWSGQWTQAPGDSPGAPGTRGRKAGRTSTARARRRGTR
jgi:arsenite-transporting ATPase